MKSKQPESTADLATLLKWARRSQGWPLRDYPPQFKRLASGCELIVIVPTLWRPRVGPRRRRGGRLVDLAGVRLRRALAAAKCKPCALDRETGDLFEGMQA